MASKASQGKIELPEFVIGNLEVEIVGTARLCIQRFSHKAMVQIDGRQRGEATIGKHAPKDPVADFVGALYLFDGNAPIVHGEFSVDMLQQILSNIGDVEDSAGEGGSFETVWAQGRFGVRSCAIKAAMVRAGTDAGLQMSDLRRQIRIPGELLEIQCEPGARMRVDALRVNGGGADLRYRPEFLDWSIVVPVRYNKSAITLPAILNLLRMAGFGVGIGEWRPAGKTCSGTWGTWEIAKVTELPDSSGK